MSINAPISNLANLVAAAQNNGAGKPLPKAAKVAKNGPVTVKNAAGSTTVKAGKKTVAKVVKPAPVAKAPKAAKAPAQAKATSASTREIYVLTVTPTEGKADEQRFTRFSKMIKVIRAGFPKGTVYGVARETAKVEQTIVAA